MKKNLWLLVTLMTMTCFLLPIICKASEQQQIDWVEEWNSNSELSDSLTKKYNGKSQCAAFTDFSHMNAFNHSSGTLNPLNTVTIEYISTGEQVESFLMDYAVPGDAIRISKMEAGKESESSTHIFVLQKKFKGEGGIEITESNFNRKDNKARYHVYENGETLLEAIFGANYSQYGYVIKCIHSLNNLYVEEPGILDFSNIYATDITATSARINCEIVNTAETPISKVGCVIRLKSTDIPFPTQGVDILSEQPYSGIVYYTIGGNNAEINIDLLAATAYCYKFYIETSSGVTLWSEEKSFKTLESPIQNFTVQKNWLGDIRVNFVTYHNINRALTNAGIYIEDSNGTTFTYKEDVNPQYYYLEETPTTYTIGSSKEIDFSFKKNESYTLQAYIFLGGIEYRSNKIYINY